LESTGSGGTTVLLSVIAGALVSWMDGRAGGVEAAEVLKARLSSSSGERAKERANFLATIFGFTEKVR